MSASPYHVVVVGGGISGLSTAFFLVEEAEKHGFPIHCTVVEQDVRWGGKILTQHLPNFLIEGGPDSFLTSKPWAVDLCKILGLGEELIPTNAEHNRTFSLRKGVLRELPQGLLAFRPQRVDSLVSGGLLSWSGLLRMAAERVWPSSAAGQSEETLGSFFRRRFGTEAFDYLIEPLVAGIYAGDADELSLEATFPKFKELEQQYGSVIRGMRTVQNKTKTGRTSKPQGSPPSLFMTLRNGLGSLIDALTQRLINREVHLMSGVGCREIQHPSNQKEAFSVNLDNDISVKADSLVLATPAFQSAKLIRNLQPKIADLLEEIPYASTATISMTYPTTDVEGHIQGFGFVVPRKEERTLLACTWTSLKWPGRSQEGESLIRCYMGGRGREALLEAEDQQLVASVRQELQSITGITSPPGYSEIHRWVRGMPQYVIGHQARLTSIQDLLRTSPTLHICGAGLYGIGIPDCIREGKRVADSLIESFRSRSGHPSV